MSDLKKTGEGPKRDVLNFWGRVKDSRGNCVEGALVMLTSPMGEEEECLGYTYSNRQGFYMISVSPPERDDLDGKVRVLAGRGVPPPPGAPECGGQYRFYPLAGKSPPVVECQIINFHLLKTIAGGGRCTVSVEAVPETVRVSFYREGLSGARVWHIRGRGYIQSGADRGEGTFSLTVCSIGEGMGEQELVRMKTLPEDRGKKSLYYDSGSVITDMFC